MIESQQRDYIRELARQAYALATSEEYEQRRRRWRDVNALRRPDRSPVWCKPIACWRELLSAETFRCSGELGGVEWQLRTWLTKHEIGDDSLIPLSWPVPAAIRAEGLPWGVEIRYHRPADAGGAYAFDPPIKDEADLDRLRLPVFTHDAAESQRRLAFMHDLLGDIFPVQLSAGVPYVPSLGNLAAELVGLDNMMLQLAMNPAMMHRLMAHLQRGVTGAMEQVEAMGLLSENNAEEMYCSDSLRRTPEGLPLKLSDLWGHAESQMFDQVSPAMWREFLLEYQRPILERFGLVSYGCCENLTHKIDGVLGLRNLRIFVCSAWTDLGKVVDAVGGRYTIMWRQKASDVVFGRPEAMRTHLREGMRRSQGCCRQIVLRELQTLSGDLRRLHTWAEYAKEAAGEYN
jgi:hypothetical protein